VTDIEERWWLDFFKNGGNYTAVPEGCPPLVKQAYEMIRTDALPPAIRSALDIEDGRYKNLKGMVEQKEQEAREEAREKLLRDMLLKQEISQETYDSRLGEVDTSAESL
jgi:hypothetical protein